MNVIHTPSICSKLFAVHVLLKMVKVSRSLVVVEALMYFGHSIMKGGAHPQYPFTAGLTV